MLVAALGVSFQSGANDSLTYEILNKIGKSGEFVKINSRIGSVGDVTVILAAPLALFIYKYYHGLPYLISFVLVLIAGIVAALVKFEFKERPKTISFYLNQIKKGVTLTLKNHRLLAIYFIWIATLTSSYVMTENISLPLQVKLGIDVGAIGFTQSAISTGFIIVSLIGYRVLNKIGGVNSLLASVVFAVISLIILSQVHAFWGAGLIVLFMIFHSFRCQVLGGLEQKELTSDQRTTMASTGNMLMTLCAALLMPLWGLLIDRTGLQNTLIYLSTFLLTIGLLGSLIYAKKKNIAQVNEPN